MQRKTILLFSLALLVLLGLAAVAYVLVSSWSPTERAKNNVRVRIPVTQIPASGSLEVEYLWYRAFIVKEDNVAVFLIPYYDKTYYLPDPTWERPFIPCKEFVSHSGGFYCDSKYFRDEADWSISGKSRGNWMPDLLTAKFRISGEYIVLSPEFE